MQRTFRLLFLASLAATIFAASVSATPSTPLSGAREPQIAGEGPAGEYLKRIHGRIHGGWTRDARTAADDAAAAAAPAPAKGGSAPAPLDVSDSTRQATVAVSIRWDGTSPS